MRVPAKHLQILVASDARYLHNVKALFEQSGCRFMAKVVKMKVFNPRASRGANKCLLDRFGRNARKYVAFDAPGKGGQYSHGIIG